MSKAPAMPLFCGDYLAATVGLSLEQSGAFLHILMAIWAGGGKPIADDDEFLARICRVTRDRWQKKIRPALAPLFDLSGGTWRNERLEREWVYVQGRIEAQRANGAKGGRPPKNGPNGPNLPAENRKENTETPDGNPLKYNDTPKPIGYVSLNPIESTLPNSSTLHVEDIPLHTHDEPIAPLRGAEEKVAFVGATFKFGAKAVAALAERYPAIPDLTKTLGAYDLALTGRPNAYGELHVKLLHENNYHSTHAARRSAPPKPCSASSPSQDRTGVRNALHAKRARHG